MAESGPIPMNWRIISIVGALVTVYLTQDYNIVTIIGAVLLNFIAVQALYQFIWRHISDRVKIIVIWARCFLTRLLVHGMRDKIYVLDDHGRKLEFRIGMMDIDAR